MSSLKQKWDRLLQSSTALAAFLVLMAAGLGLFVAIGIGVVLAKISTIIK